MEEVKFWDKNLSVSSQIKNLEKGGKVAFPISKLTNIRANLSTYGAMLQRKYSSHVNREAQTIEVTREK